MRKLQPSSFETAGEFARDVLRGLSARPRTLSPKYFYDEAGSALFEEITRQPEYYLTRTEASILRRCAPSISELVGRDVSLVELGSGSSAKTRILLESLLQRYRRLRYLPIDISESILHETASELDRRYPALEVTPIASPYESGLSRASVLVGEEEGTGSMLVLFLGSSIGNMEPQESVDFLARVRSKLGGSDRLLVGFDLVKDDAVLDAAYNDAAGVTARFNLNLLARINRELGADFDRDRFSHRAFFSRERRRIEMHLVSRARQEIGVRALGRAFSFDPGETIHTENSYKYTLADIERLASGAGLSVAEVFTDESAWFALALFAPA
jgi:dimethylhistidine N-methyltransferase